MVRFAAEINAESPEELKAFDRGYRFDEARSTETEYVFIKSWLRKTANALLSKIYFEIRLRLEL